MFLFYLLIKIHMCAFPYTMVQGNTLVPEELGDIKVKLCAFIYAIVQGNTLVPEELGDVKVKL